MYNADQQTDTLKSIYDQQRADRAPALAAYNTALANPDTWYNSAPAMGSLDAVLRKLSAQTGSPVDPGALSRAAAYNLGGYNSYLSGLAGPAFGGQQTQATLGTNIANTQGGALTTLAGGLSDILNPKPQGLGMADLLKLFVGGTAV